MHGMKVLGLQLLDPLFAWKTVRVGLLCALAIGRPDTVGLEIPQKMTIQPDIGPEQGAAGLENLIFMKAGGHRSSGSVFL
jgi:hypothetical protein